LIHKAVSKMRFQVGPGWAEDYETARNEGRTDIKVQETFTMPKIDDIDPVEVVRMTAVTWEEMGVNDAVTNYNTGALRY